MKRFSQQEKYEYVRLYQNRFEDGKSAEEVSKRLGVSISTLLSWQRSFWRRTVKQPSKGAIDINSAIADFCAEGNTPTFGLLKAICQVSAWIRWPRQSEYHWPATWAAIATYLSERAPEGRLLGEVKVAKDDFIANLSMQEIAQIYKGEFGIHLNFDDYTIQCRPYMTTNVLADLGLLYLSRSSCDGRKKISFEDAYSALYQGISKYQLNCSETYFRQLWRERLSSVPFLYVRDYMDGPQLPLDPSSIDFFLDIDRVIANCELRRRFVSLSIQAAAGVRSRLTGMTQAKFQTVEGPAGLPDYVLNVPPLIEHPPRPRTK